MILVLIFIGCALATVGVLYFIDIKFCRDRLTAAVALGAGLVMLAGAEIALAGSSSSFYKAQMIATSACELEGEGAHPENRGRDEAGVIGKHIVGCMKTAGYFWSGEHKHCQDAPVATNPLCYLPRATFGRAVTLAQVAFE